MTERQEMMATFEAVLFVAPDPVSRNRLLDLFAAEERPEAEKALDELLMRYQLAPEQQEEGHGVRIEEVAGGYRLTTRPHLNEALRRFFEASRAKKLSMGALETLAIVAYRQPVTAPEIQELRGVSPSGVLKTLLERRMVRIAGRKEVVGKPFLYATTQDFLVHFGLRGLKDLPPLEEFEEALAGDGLGELLVGTDLEEEVLQTAARLEEQAEDQALKEEALAEEDLQEAALREEEDFPEEDTAGEASEAPLQKSLEPVPDNLSLVSEMELEETTATEIEPRGTEEAEENHG
ncbi:MAG: SMC-Scp complex subunit ScpB [Deltaproteobacteria bacterium]|nr:SMC-Scp complex subunit ScpB [Deltaproteobacteria bacterium]